MNKSFTLIEILIVIVVIGTLSAFILIGMSSITDSANITNGKAFSDSLRNSLLTNLVSEWKLDEGTGTQIKDSWGISANGNFGCYGTSCVNPQWKLSSCVSGSCIEFDCLRNYGDPDGSAGSYVRIEQNSDINLSANKPFTLEYWIKFNRFIVGDYVGTVMKGSFGSSYGHLTTGRNIIVYTDDDTGAELQVVNFFDSGEVNKWVHIVQTYDSNQKIIIYKNSKTSTGYQSGTGIELTINASPLFLGTNAGTIYFFDGFLDDVRIYKEALVSFKIKKNYYIGINKLFKNKEISIIEFNQRLAELRYSLANNE